MKIGSRPSLQSSDSVLCDYLFRVLSSVMSIAKACCFFFLIEIQLLSQQLLDASNEGRRQARNLSLAARKRHTFLTSPTAFLDFPRLVNVVGHTVVKLSRQKKKKRG